MIRRASSRTRYLLSDCIAILVRSGRPAPEMTLQLCATESILHSSLVRDPRAEPSSKYARRYHSPSQADLSTASAYWSAFASISSRVCASLRLSACTANFRSVEIRNHANQTLSPFPSIPTLFMPSFQSPLRMPPVLDIAFHELTRRCPDDLISGNCRIGVHESHHVLQLVTEPECTTRLVQRRSRPHAAG